jgi:predicted RNase H-like HicB family nuclease
MLKEQWLNIAILCFFEPAEEGGFVVTCPHLPGLVTEGDTAEDAIRGYIESLQKDHLPIPSFTATARHPRGTAMRKHAGRRDSLATDLVVPRH